MELEDQRSAVHDALIAYQPIWLEHRTKVARADGKMVWSDKFGELLFQGLSSLANEQFRIINGHNNFLLERYFQLTGGVELELQSEPVEPLVGYGME